MLPGDCGIRLKSAGRLNADAGDSTDAIAPICVALREPAQTPLALPAGAALDSVNLRPTLLGETGGNSLRDHTLQQALGQALSIRQGPWKYLDHRGSGGDNYEQGELKPFALPDTAPDAPGQLYNLADGPGETNNLYFQRPEIFQRLKSLLETSKDMR
jgi:hypothetical protein